jgi:DNA polymerase-1
MLFWLAQQHDYPRLMVKHRLLSKKYGTYYKGLKEALWSDGRMRPSIKLHGTVTGRQSSSGPNIHGTPRDDMIKDTYIADDGYVLLDADFPQAEMRMIGHIAGDKRFIEVLRERDIHVTVAKKLYRLTDEEWDDLDASEVGIRRRAAKTVGFGIIYGRGAKGLAPQLGVPVEEAQMYINRLFIEVMPGVYIWIQKQKERVLIDQEVRSIYDRKRRFPLIANRSQRSEIQRMAVNMPVQSSVSDMTTLAYIKSCAKFDKIGLPYKRYSQIHDDFKIQVMKDAVKEAAAIVKSTMENDLDFETEVPFGPVEVKSGRSWGSLALVGI